MQIIDINCWIILASSVVIMACAMLALVAHSYIETVSENVALVCVALSGFIVCLQIVTTGFSHISGMTFMSISVALYAVSHVHKKWRQIARANKIEPFPTLFS